MFDQSFSSKNLRRIFDLENRKGNYLDQVFLPDVEAISNKIKSVRARIRKTKSVLRQQNAAYKFSPTPTLQKKISHEERKLSRYRKLEVGLRAEKEVKLNSIFDQLSSDITKGKIDTTLTQVVLPTGQTAFKLSDVPETYFPIKQIQYNISKSFQVSPADRLTAVRQLAQALNDDYPKIIVRTDIEKFYESLSADRLDSILYKNRLLSLTSKKVIKDVLRKYRSTSLNQNGVPRGVGLSAHLSEIYMEEFDKAFSADPDVLFYSRFVDDIVVIFDGYDRSKSPADRTAQVAEKIKSVNLKANTAKTKTKSNHNNSMYSFEYLGYIFEKRPKKKVVVDMSKKRLSRYKSKLSKSFKLYTQLKHFNEKRERANLVARVKFLSSNTHLVNNKRKAMVGIFFSNSEISSTKSLEVLDIYLNMEIAKLSNPVLVTRLKKLSFKRGFEKRIYRKFSTRALGRLTRAWKYEI